MRRSSFTLICLFITSLLYAQEPVNLLSNLKISQESGSVVISLDFNGPVSFTSMKLSDPYRIVLDFTDCKKGSSVKNKIKVNSDGIKEISITQMGSNDAPILRVIISTAVDLDFNIEPTDNGINVKIAGVKLASIEEPQKAQSEQMNVVEVKPQNQEEVKSEVREETAPAVATAKAEPAPSLTESTPEPKVEPAPTTEEVKPEVKEETAPAVATAKTEPVPSPIESKPEPKVEPAPKTEEVKPEVRQETAPAVATAKTEPAPSPIESKLEPRVEPTPKTEEIRSEVSETSPSRYEKKESSAKNVSKKTTPKSTTSLASQEDYPRRSEHISNQPRKVSSGGRNSLTWIGFQVSATGSRVFVKTLSEAEYSIKEKDEKTLVLEIYNTNIPKKNNRRPLDTSYFNSPVAYISPSVEGGSLVRIEIRLKERVPFITRQEANALYVDFEGAKASK